MNTLALGLSAAAFVVVMGTWTRYLSTIPGGNVPVRPIGSIILQCTGIVLALAALIRSYQSGEPTGVAVIMPAVVALMMGSTFLWLLTLRKTPIGDLKVSVGDRLPAFEAATAEGTTFRTDELAGKRILLKFFRGGW